MPDFALDKAILQKVAAITGNFVGDTDTQTLTNKTVSNPTISGAVMTIGGTNDLIVQSTGTNNATLVDIVPTYTTVADASARGILRLLNSSDYTNAELLQIQASGTAGYTFSTFAAGTGSIRPFKFQINFNDILTMNTDNTMNFNSRTTTNAVFTAPTISTITNTGTLTLPTTTDTLVGRATTDTLTNKTVDAGSNTLIQTAQSPLVKRTGSFQPSGGTTATTVGFMDGMLSQHVGTGAGTNTVTFDTTEGMITNYVSSAASGVNVGLVSPANPLCRRLFACKMVARVKIDSTTSARMYVGFSAAAAVAISDTPAASGSDCVLVGFTSTATNFEIYSNDSTAGFVTNAMTTPVAKNNSWHTIEINWTASGNVNVIFDSTNTTTLTTQIPLTTTSLFFNCVGQTTSTTARTLSIHGVWIECDK